MSTQKKKERTHLLSTKRYRYGKCHFIDCAICGEPVSKQRSAKICLACRGGRLLADTADRKMLEEFSRERKMASYEDIQTFKENTRVNEK